MADQSPPRTVRAAGALVGLQGLTGVGFTIALLSRVLGGTDGAGKVLGEAGYYAILGAGVLAAGIGLSLGKHWARTPAVVVQLLLGGVAWYVMGPSGRPGFGIPLALVCAVVLVLLFTGSGRAWAFHAATAPDARPDSERSDTDAGGTAR